MKSADFLPVSRADMEKRGWDECDFIFISGDAYVDHPSFAAAIISRVLEADGYRVGIIPQPAVNSAKEESSFSVLGRPRLAFLVGAGNLDSMVAHYTANKKPRSEDAYSPGGKRGFRPDRAILKYVEGVRRTYKNIPVIIGGIEASLRRFAHYDYWSDTVRRSVLLDSKADLLVYGMGENAIRNTARRLADGIPINEIHDVCGTVFKSDECPASAVNLPAYDEIRGVDQNSLKKYSEHFMIQKRNSSPSSGNPAEGRQLAEPNDGGRWVIQNPPALPLEQKEFDRIYELPFTGKAHPVYEKAGGVPALKEVEFSLNACRGCFGGCSFCAIGIHQGRAVRSRSGGSLEREAKRLAAKSGFKGYIHDVGGPTANFYGAACKKQEKGEFCTDRECLFPSPCPNLKADHGKFLQTLKKVKTADSKIKKVFIRSGIRFDFIKRDKSHGDEFLKTLCREHISGQLKIAPEHISAKVLEAMGKMSGDEGAYEKFGRQFKEINSSLGLRQYLLPYFISGHPGSGLDEAIELALFLKKSGFVPDQVQDFYPTPGTLSTVMYRTGIDPHNGGAIHVPGEREKRLQRALLHYNKKENRSLVREALKLAGREDLLSVLGGKTGR